MPLHTLAPRTVMHLTNFESTVLNGHIELPAGIVLPDHTRVHVVVADASPTAQIRSPRLADPSRLSEFEMKVEDAEDAGL